MNTCKDCRHWQADDYDRVAKPIDYETGEEMEVPFEVRRCKSTELMEFERPQHSNQAAVCDGSDYRAVLITGPDFGCVKWEAKP